MRLRTKFSTQVRRACEISYAAYEISYRGGLNFVRAKFRTCEISYARRFVFLFFLFCFFVFLFSFFKI